MTVKSHFISTFLVEYCYTLRVWGISTGSYYGADPKWRSVDNIPATQLHTYDVKVPEKCKAKQSYNRNLALTVSHPG